jgi:hypothetical protein
VWNRLASDFAESGQASPAIKITDKSPVGEVETLDATGYLAAGRPQSTRRVRPRRLRVRTIATVGVAASVLLGALFVAQASRHSKLKTNRIEPAAAAFLSNLKADDDSYQLSAGRQFAECVPAGTASPNPTTCRLGLQEFVTAMRAIVADLDGRPAPASLSAAVARYRLAIQTVVDSANRAIAAVGTSAFAQAHADVADADSQVCNVLAEFNAAGNGVVVLAPCPLRI